MFVVAVVGVAVVVVAVVAVAVIAVAIVAVVAAVVVVAVPVVVVVAVVAVVAVVVVVVVASDKQNGPTTNNKAGTMVHGGNLAYRRQGGAPPRRCQQPGGRIRARVATLLRAA